MKNTKKLLILVLALIALTLAMSISIFAKTYEVGSQSELFSANSSAQDGDTIKFTQDFSLGGGTGDVLTVTKAITIDFNGKTLTTNYGYSNLALKNNGCVLTSSALEDDGVTIKRGTVRHLGGVAIIKVWNAGTIENLNLWSDRQVANKTSGGIALQNKENNAAYTDFYISTIKNVSLYGNTITYGIETQNRTGNAVGSLEDVTISANTDGIQLKGASIGSATNCTISGKTSGIYITGTEVSISLSDCVVTGEASAVKIESSSDVVISANDKTAESFASTNGPVFVTNGNAGVTEFEIPGYTFADGKITCETHKYVVTNTVTVSCESDGYTEETCSSCKTVIKTNVVPKTGHAYSETSRVEATEEADGYIEYTCANCQGTKRETLLYCEHNFVVLEEVKVSCLVDGYVKSECSLCGKIKEVTTPKEAHTYDWNIVGCPKCGTVATPDVEGGKISTNLGYTVFFAASWQEIANNVSASSTYDVIRLTADSTVPSGNNFAQVKNKSILIDLGGNTITTPNSYASIYLYMAEGLVNGTLVHGGGRQGLVCYNVDFIEDITINVTATMDKNATGMIVNNSASYGASQIGSMKNVTITGNIPNNGMEIRNDITVIGSMDDVKVYSHGQAIISKAKIGTMTNCVFSGDNVGLALEKINGEFKLVNCEVYGGTLAILISGVVEETAPTFKFGTDTKFVTDGVVYVVEKTVASNFTNLTSAVALVNGKLYTSLEEAIEALENSTEAVTTFALVQNLKTNEAIVINKQVNFSFGGGEYKVPIYGTANYNSYTADGYTVTAPNGLFKVVEGGTLKLSGDGYVRSNDKAIVAEGGSVVVDGGTYYGYDPTEYVQDGFHALYNEENDSYKIGEHKYDVIYGNDYNDGVCDCGYVRGIARIGDIFYLTFAEAFSAAKEGDTIILLQAAVITEDVTYDLTGLTIRAYGDAFEVQSGTLILNGNGKVEAGVYNDGSYCAIWANGGHVIINGGTYSVGGDAYSSDTTHQNDLVYTKNGGTVLINGGTFAYNESIWTLNENDANRGTIVVKGGSFGKFNPANNVSEGPNTSFVASGYHSHVDSEGNYYVEKITEEIIEAKTPTCTETGLTEGKKCAVCGVVLVEQADVDALGHSMSGWILTTAPVYGEVGEETNKCANCDYAETRAYNAAAKIGDVYYATFAEAYDAKEAGTTIVLLAPITVTSDMTLNIEGITIESAGDVFVVTGGTLTIEGNGVVNAGTAGIGSWCAVWANGGTVVINGGTYSVGGDESTDDVNHQNDLIYTKNGGKVTINGGTFIAGEGIWALNENDANRGTITVNGGKFVGFNPANNVSEGEGTNFVADGYHAQKVDNVYTVAPHSFVLNDIVYKNGFENAGVKINTCAGCGATYEEATEAIFKNLGLSASEFEVGGITIGYKVNTEFLEEYEAVTGNEITYGVFAVLADKIGNGDILNEKGTPAAGVINKEIKSYGINEFNFKLVGFTTEKLMSAKIVMGAYVFERTQEGVNVSYIQPNVPQEGERYYAVSYNGLTGKED